MILYEWTPPAEEQLRKLPLAIQRRIVHKLEWYFATPDPLHFAEPLVGQEGKAYRFRITVYRVAFEVVKGKILITKVGHRRDVYR